jgi:hypothetical protein
VTTPTGRVAAPGAADALDGRRTWRTLEPIHAIVYFAPEAAARYGELGLGARSAYFASRSAPMGALSTEAVTATFFNFHPELVARAMAGVWDRLDPAQVLEARLAVAGTALERLLGDAVGSPEMARAAELARRAAGEAGAHVQGRPLFAGHAGLRWPDEPHLVLWHAQSLLREFRGDGHVALLLAAGMGPVEALVVHAATGEVPAETLRTSRAWSEDEWAAGVAAVRRRGWLADGDALVLSEEGRGQRQRMEDDTDELARPAYAVLTPDECAELRRLCRTWSRALAEAMPARADATWS